jgi:hypothetical protein
MKGSLLSAAICRAIRFPGLAMMISLCVGASSPRSEPSVNPPQTQQNRASQLIAGPEFKQRQIAFLNRIRDADPQQRVIDRAMLNKQNELDLILDRSVEMNKIPELMRTLVAQSVGRMQLGYDAPLLIANFDCTS